MYNRGRQKKCLATFIGEAEKGQSKLQSTLLVAKRYLQVVRIALMSG